MWKPFGQTQRELDRSSLGQSWGAVDVGLPAPVGLWGLGVRRLVAITCAVLVGATALSVAIGWVSQNPLLVQWRPHIVPVQFNTALCLLLLAVTLIGNAARRWRFTGLILAGATSGLALLTLVQYAFELSLGLDELFVDAFLTTRTVSPGRMSIFSALSFLLLGVVSIGEILRVRHSPLVIAAGVMCTLSGAGAAIVLTGYLFDTPATYRWDDSTDMAPGTALSILLLSVGHLLLIRRMLDERTRFASIRAITARFLYLPTIIYVGSAVLLALLIYVPLARDLRDQAEESLMGVLTREAAQIRRQIDLHAWPAEQINARLTSQGADLLLPPVSDTALQLYLVTGEGGSVRTYSHSDQTDLPLAGSEMETWRNVLRRALGLPSVSEQELGERLLPHRNIWLATPVIDGRLALAGVTDWGRDQSTGFILLGSAVPVVFVSGLWIWLLLSPMARQAASVEADLRQRVKEATESLRQKAKALEASNQDLEQFAYIASHDLQEPVRKIQAFSELMEADESEALSATGKDYLARIQAAGLRMRTLIQDLLAFSRAGTRKESIQQLDLGEVIRGACDDLDTAIRDSGAQIELSDEWPQVRLDPSLFRLVFCNLIQNSIKFTKQGEPPRIRITAVLEERNDGEPWVRVEVRDHGIGFEQKYADRVFKPFQRLHSQREYAGSGIGLAICRRILERHDGSIHVRGRLGEGALFVLEWPQVPGRD